MRAVDLRRRAPGATVHRNVPRLIKHTGDGFMATFDGPNRAIRCDATLRSVLDGKDITIRSGLHVGEVELRDDDVGGVAVHTAGRVMAETAASRDPGVKHRAGLGGWLGNRVSRPGRAPP